MNPFDYVNSINNGKNLLDETDDKELAIKDYNAFMTNRALSYHIDTVMFSNAMNQYSHLDKGIQYSFFINTIKPKKRFAKWAKPEKNDVLDIIVEYYGYSYEKAKQVLDLFSSRELDAMKQKLKKGGAK
tara:strand:- start:3156 stop:3542 length:387 start_codon:yes stop_codon:yes gene_type:complete